jgi:hypothetical protein
VLEVVSHSWEGEPQAGQGRLGVGHRGERLGVGAVGALYAAVELGAAGRQGEAGDPPLGAGGLELGHELTPVVDADGPHRDGHPLGQRGEDDQRGAGARGSAQFEHVRSG